MKNPKILLGLLPLLALFLIIGSGFTKNKPIASKKTTTKNVKAKKIVDYQIIDSRGYLCANHPSLKDTLSISPALPSGSSVTWTTYDCNLSGSMGNNPATITGLTAVAFANPFLSITDATIDATVSIPGQGTVGLEIVIPVNTCP
ncbi:hypothetical protein ACFS5N_10280 [Mucilaginibacter ximonensis]|uniref:Ig-like domain-containing protein n=1 Tax=Mucilaginibacter ximonensis TaxID=538021 RepID=A0ABW5YD07_9SPHI